MEEQLTLETPEQVEVSFELAGLASRGIAAFIDSLLQLLIIFILLLALIATEVVDQGSMIQGLESLRETAEGAPISTSLPDIFKAILGLAIFGISWGYHVFFELSLNGRSPGKMLLGLRVLLDGGTPITSTASLIRNLVRIIDFLPLYYAAGVVTLMVDGRGKRLGDLAAGTVVVRERRLASNSERHEESTTKLLEPELALLLSQFLQRRSRLEPTRRKTLGTNLARPLQARFGGEALDIEPFLEALLEANRTGTQPPWLRVTKMHDHTGPSGRAAVASPLDPFEAARRQRRTELTRLVDRFETQGPRKLSPEMVEALGRLHRACSADLARASRGPMNAWECQQLNALLARVHPQLYRGRPHRLRVIGHFFLTGFPRLFRRTAPYTLAAGLAFGIPGMLTYLAVKDDPTLTYALLNPATRANADAFEQAPTGGRVGGQSLVASSFYITNNTSVAFRAFAGGVTAGLITVVVLVSNGIQIGATAALVEHLHSTENFWAFVSPHGALELLAIFLAGGGGLKLGLAILHPGDRTRREAMVHHGREATAMAVGAALLLIWAGLTEGFVSPSDLSNPTKVSLGLLNALVLGLYLRFGDRASAHLFSVVPRSRVANCPEID